MSVQQRVQNCIGALALISVLSACAQPLSTREKGALVGGGLGAASGAIIGVSGMSGQLTPTRRSPFRGREF
jgi:hypothetical protein